jgi:hypothetical protein
MVSILKYNYEENCAMTYVVPNIEDLTSIIMFNKYTIKNKNIQMNMFLYWQRLTTTLKIVSMIRGVGTRKKEDSINQDIVNFKL